MLLAVGTADADADTPRRNRVCTDAEAEGGGNSKEEKQEEEGLKQLFCHCCASLPVKGAGNRALMAPNVASICTSPLTVPHFSPKFPVAILKFTSSIQFPVRCCRRRSNCYYSPKNTQFLMGHRKWLCLP